MKTCRKTRRAASDFKAIPSLARRASGRLVSPASPDETLCLLEAFLRVSNPIIRSAIIDVVSEQAAYG